MTPTAALSSDLLALAAARGVGLALAGLPPGSPAPLYLGVAALVACLSLVPGAGPAPAALAFEGLALEVGVGVLLGAALSLPLRAATQGAALGARQAGAPRGWVEAATLVGLTAWVAGGGLELLVGGLVGLSAQLPLGVAPELEGGALLVTLGRVGLAVLMGAALPALTFRLGSEVFLALVLSPPGAVRRRSPMSRPVAAVLLVAFLAAWTPALAGAAGPAVLAGMRLATGGT